MAYKEFLGRGMKFPPQVNPATGRFETSEGNQSVKESIYIILMTQKTERILKPGFGASLMSYTFMDTSVTMLNVMARELENELATQEPRIEAVSVDVDPNVKDGCLIVNISYTVRETNTRDNMVFPFYLNATWEEEETVDENAEL